MLTLVAVISAALFKQATTSEKTRATATVSPICSGQWERVKELTAGAVLGIDGGSQKTSVICALVA